MVSRRLGWVLRLIFDLYVKYSQGAGVTMPSLFLVFCWRYGGFDLTDLGTSTEYEAAAFPERVGLASESIPQGLKPAWQCAAECQG